MCESLEVRPAEVFVKQRLDETVKRPNDDTIVSASPPPQIVEKGKLGDGLIVESVADKYLDHLPVERQCQRFERIGIEIAPQTLGRGVNAAIDLLMPIAKLIEGETRGPGLLGTDATGIPILDRDAPLGIRNGAMWCWTNALWVSFFYSKSGDSEERASLSRRRPRSHRAVRWHEHPELHRTGRRQASRMLEPRA